MKRESRNQLLVIVGGWNTFIFNPEWVKKFLSPDEEITAEFPIMSVTESSPRFILGEVSFSVVANRLIFETDKHTDKNYEKIERLANLIIDYLPHTPTQSFGVNFKSTFKKARISTLFETEDKEILKDNGYKIKNTSIKHSFSSEVVEEINITISKGDEAFQIDFNFHQSITSLHEIRKYLSQYGIKMRWETSNRIIKEIYSSEDE